MNKAPSKKSSSQGSATAAPSKRKLATRSVRAGLDVLRALTGGRRTVV